MERLEDRLLFDASPLPIGAHPFLDCVAAITERTLIPPMSGREGGDGDSPESNAPPVCLGLPPVILGEDNNNYRLDFRPLFSDDRTPNQNLQFQLLSYDNEELFDEVLLANGQLTLDLARHAFGESTMIIRATDGEGASVDVEMPVTVLPYNDRPTTTGIRDTAVRYGTKTIEVDLFAAFDDVEDPDSALTYEVTRFSRPELIQSYDIDRQRGVLRLTLNPAAMGSTTVTLRATDTGGLSVETSEAAARFQVYDLIQEPSAITSHLGMPQINLVTDWALFPQVNGQYDYTRFDADQLRWYLNSSYFDPSLPVLFDIENDLYVNTPEGRERLAEVLRVFWDERPECDTVGFFWLIPDQDYWETAPWAIARKEASQGIESWWTANMPGFETVFREWQARNLWYQNAPLRDGTVLIDHVTVVGPAFYTPYRYGILESGGLPVFPIHYDGNANRFTIPDTVLANGLQVQLNPSTIHPLPAGFQSYVSYYVTNVNGHEFQLSQSPGGDPIPLAPGAAGDHFLRIHGPRNFIEHDFELMKYEANLRVEVEASRLYGLPVYGWLSPSFGAKGGTYLDEDVFRWQLDLMLETVDHVIIYDPPNPSAMAPHNLGWYRALEGFMTALRTPTTFEIQVVGGRELGNGSNDGSGGTYVTRNMRFDGIAYPSFAMFGEFLDEGGQGRPGRVYSEYGVGWHDAPAASFKTWQSSEGSATTGSGAIDPYVRPLLNKAWASWDEFSAYSVWRSKLSSRETADFGSDDGESTDDDSQLEVLALGIAPEGSVVKPTAGGR